MKKPHQKTVSKPLSEEYGGLIGGIAELLEAARRTAARTLTALMTAAYWEIGRRIVEFEQGGEKRAEYGEGLLARLADDLTARFGRGFSRQNLQRFRLFYLSQPAEKICSTLSSKLTGGIGSTPSNELGEATIVQTLSAKSKVAKIRPTPSDISQAPSGKSSLFALSDLARAFPLPWSHYVLLISRTRSPEAFAFYHAEALRGIWRSEQPIRVIPPGNTCEK